jgi:hypothetical protein
VLECRRSDADLVEPGKQCGAIDGHHAVTIVSRLISTAGGDAGEVDIVAAIH